MGGATRLKAIWWRKSETMAMRISCHAITWNSRQIGLIQAMDEVRALGFTGFEAFADVADDFGFERLSEFQDLLASRGLKLVALYGGGQMQDPAMFDELVGRNTRIARFLAANGADRLVLGPGRKRSGGATRDDLLNQVHCMNEIGRRALDLGVQACVHPHYNTAIETIEEIDFIIDRVDPRFVAMAADTAHFRKSNPTIPDAEVQVFRKHADRILYVHLKDWDPGLPPEVVGESSTAVIRDFTELGQGVVHLRDCIEILKTSGYEGWLTIELDYTRRTPWESVEMSKRYLESELGLTV
jgi:inosose dehydratase